MITRQKFPPQGKKVYKLKTGNYYLFNTGSTWRISSDYNSNRFNAEIEVRKKVSNYIEKLRMKIDQGP